MATESGIPTSSTKPVSSQNRKSSKPIMEKRRRARINASLSELKALLLEVMKKEGTRHHKMEKADILEMTVKHLRTIQRQQFTASAVHEPSVVTKYHSGFSECASEVTRYLSNVEGVDVELRARVLNHLANSLQNVGSQAPSVSPSPSAVSTFTRPETCGGSSSPVHIAPKGSISPDINNNTMSVIQTVQQPSLASHTPLTVNTSLTAVTSSDANMQAKMMSGLQVIPTKLQNGEIAFVLSGSNVPCVIPIYAGTNQQQQTVVSPGVQSPMQSPASLPPQSPIVVTPTSPSSTSSLKSPNSIASLCSPNRTTPPPQVSSGGLQEDDNTPQDLSYSSSRSEHQSQEDMDTDSSDNNTPKNSDNLSNQKVVNMNQIVQPFSSDMWRPW